MMSTKQNKQNKNKQNKTQQSEQTTKHNRTTPFFLYILQPFFARATQLIPPPLSPSPWAEHHGEGEEKEQG